MKNDDITAAWTVATAAAPPTWDVWLGRHDGSYEASAGPSDGPPATEVQAATPVKALTALTVRLLELEHE